MEQKTKIAAEAGKQELVITREFYLPVELLFKAYVEPDIVEQWMGTKVLKLENKNHGSWQFETKDPKGNVVFRANGVIHEFSPNRRIIRTFEMENAPFGVQLEFLELKGGEVILDAACGNGHRRTAAALDRRSGHRRAGQWTDDCRGLPDAKVNHANRVSLEVHPR